MEDDRGWDRIVDAIDARYGLTSHGRDARPLEDRQDLTEQVRFITFERNGQSYKLERVTRPAIIDKRSVYHKAATGGVRHENVYDPEQLAHKTICFRKVGTEWEEIDPEELGV